jgi:hypothetical protein
MYNMRNSLFGYKMNGTTIIFIVVLILFICHIFCNCRNQYLIENLENLNNKTNLQNNATKKNSVQPKKEGFTGLNKNKGMYSPYSLNTGSVDTSSWKQDNLVVTKNYVNPAVQKFLDRPHQPVPLPKGEMDLFFNTQFKPECCPNMYSTSSGCACMTGKQYNWLVLRGGNNVPYSQY